MQLRRNRKSLITISLVPLVDVMLILLVFFMVTSTYLDLDMLPVAEASPINEPVPDTPSKGDAASPFLIRLTADGTPSVRGRSKTLGSIALDLQARLAKNPSTQVVVLPSPTASIQSLVSLMELATNQGATSLRVVRLEAPR